MRNQEELHACSSILCQMVPLADDVVTIFISVVALHQNSIAHDVIVAFHLQDTCALELQANKLRAA